jgi:predicted HicB family RNase H-like nuclease
MTLTVHLPEELERRLVREAERHGVGLETYAVQLLEEHVPRSDKHRRRRDYH